MNQRIDYRVLALAASALIVAACAGAGSTTSLTGPASTSATTATGDTATTAPMTEAPSADVIAGLQADLADFSSEVEAAASAQLTQAWLDLEAQLASLGNEVQEGSIGDIDLTPVREAVDEVSDAVAADQDELSAEFQEFWSDFTSRFNSIMSS
jgi:hypothetical protein